MMEAADVVDTVLMVLPETFVIVVTEEEDLSSEEEDETSPDPF